MMVVITVVVIDTLSSYMNDEFPMLSNATLKEHTAPFISK